MKVRKVLTSVTFRFMALYVVALSIAVFVVMAVIYGFFTNSYFDDLQESISAELDTLAATYQARGVAGVEQYIERQQATATARRFHYLLTDEDFHKLAGTLSSWPEYEEFGEGWVAFGLSVTDIGVDDPGLEEGLLARHVTLDDGHHLLAALRTGDVLETTRIVMGTLVRTMLATVALGIIGGFFAASNTLRRIEKVNRGIERVVKGDYAQRIPVGDAAGNVRELIENSNRMLDQIQSLMAGVRTVSDNIAHDLRTPLTRMRNRLSKWQARLEPEDAEEAQQLIEECDAILSTFNALLRIAQLEAGNRISNFTPLELSAVVNDVVELYEPLAMEKQQSLQCHCSIVNCDGDRDLLFQMLANLLDNAVKYTPVGGHIEVRCGLGADGKPLLSVADSGPGIPPESRDSVFQRFFRLESSRGVQPGNGLGLSLVQAVVKLHRGQIELGSNDPGLRVEIRLG